MKLKTSWFVLFHVDQVNARQVEEENLLLLE